MSRAGGVLALMLFFVVTMTGQDTTAVDVGTPGDFYSGYEALYGALVVIGGYFSHIIPGLNKISSNIYRVLAFAIITGGVFVTFGWMDGISALMTYAISTSFYEVILKFFAKNRGEEILENQ